MRIGIIVDNPKRDLNGCTLLAYSLADNGYQVYLIPMYYQLYDVPALELDVVVLNYVRNNNRDIAKYYKELGISIVINDTEGGILSADGLDSPKNWAKYLKKENYNNFVDYYTFWGSKVHEAFEKVRFKKSENLLVTGCPRYDFCNKKWRKFLEYKDKNYVLINTNFSAINPLFTKNEKKEKRIFKELGWDNKYIDDFFEDNKRVFNSLITELLEITTQLPELTFILRPHPFESSDFYKKIFEKSPNVKVTGEGDVLNVINNSFCILHINCGTSVEANLLGKPSLCLDYINTEMQINHTPLPRQMSVCLSSRSEAIKLIKQCASSNIDYDFEDNIKKYIEPWFHANDGLAHKRLLDVILKASVLSNEKIATCKSFDFSKIQKLQKIFVNCFGSKSLSDVRAYLSKSRIYKQMYAEDIDVKISKIKSIDGNPKEFTIKHAIDERNRKMSSIFVGKH